MSTESGMPPDGDDRTANDTHPRNTERWKELARLVMNESDPEELMRLVAELIAEYDRALKTPGSP